MTDESNLDCRKQPRAGQQHAVDPLYCKIARGTGLRNRGVQLARTSTAALWPRRSLRTRRSAQAFPERQNGAGGRLIDPGISLFDLRRIEKCIGFPEQRIFRRQAGTLGQLCGRSGRRILAWRAAGNRAQSARLELPGMDLDPRSAAISASSTRTANRRIKLPSCVSARPSIPSYISSNGFTRTPDFHGHG